MGYIDPVINEENRTIPSAEFSDFFRQMKQTSTVEILFPKLNGCDAPFQRRFQDP
jgi:hypothetical protein